MLVGVGVSPSIIYARPNLALALLSSAAVWPDVQDLSSMRIGRNGSGAASVGQPVGFIANKGANGTSGRSIEAASSTFNADIFATTAGYTVSSGSAPTIVDGWLVYSPGGAYAWTSRDYSTAADIWYRLVGEFRRGSSDAKVFCGSGSGRDDHGFVYLSASGTFEMIFRATSTSFNVGVQSISGSGVEFRLGALSVLPGSHLVAPSDAARYVVRATPSRLEWASGRSMTMTLASGLGSSCTIGTCVSGVTTWLDAQTINAGSYAIPAETHTAHAVWSRALSADEKAAVAAYWASIT